MKTLIALPLALSGSVWISLVSGTDVSAQELSEYCQNVYAEYSERPGPKAFVTGSDGSCWYWYGANTLAQSQRNAIDACERERPNEICTLRESSF